MNLVTDAEAAAIREWLGSEPALADAESAATRSCRALLDTREALKAVLNEWVRFGNNPEGTTAYETGYYDALNRRGEAAKTLLNQLRGSDA